MRFRENTEADQDRARSAVKAWRDEHPDGTPEEMLADLGPGFHPDYGPVLRAVLFRAGLDDAKVTAGITIITRENPVTRRTATACPGVPIRCGFQPPGPPSPRRGGGRGNAGVPRPPEGRP
ncbi:MAG TPA: hypothetical protein VGI96_48650 [Streptosporangiaceae bacterium]